MMLKTIPTPSNTRRSKTSDKGDNLGLSWWLEVGTANPPCINYYGPFDSQGEAEVAKDTSQQEPQIIFSHSKFCQPRQRTLTENDFTIQDLEACPPTFFEVLLGDHRIY